MTTIAAIRYHDEVAVAADSALHDPNLGTIGSVCKLLAYGQYFIGVSGAYRGNNAEVNFDLFFELNRICDSSATSGLLADRIVAELLPAYTTLLRSMAKLDPETYQRAYRDDPTVFAFLLAGFESGLPFIRGRQFKLVPLATNQWNIGVDRVDYVEPPATKEVNLLVLGSNKGFYEFVSARPSFWKLSAVEAARFAVAFEIADVPDRVQPPIDVLRLTKEGHSWVQRKSGCQDQAESSSTQTVT